MSSASCRSPSPSASASSEGARTGTSESDGTTSTSTVVKPRPARGPRQAEVVRQDRRSPVNDTTITAVVKDAARLLSWGRDWHELPEAIARIADRPSVAAGAPDPAQQARLHRAAGRAVRRANSPLTHYRSAPAWMSNPRRARPQPDSSAALRALFYDLPAVARARCSWRPCAVATDWRRGDPDVARRVSAATWPIARYLACSHSPTSDSAGPGAARRSG